MARRITSRALVGLGVGLLLTGAAARGDDWAQFRRDPGRSGRSTDPVQFPLVEVWSQPSRGSDGYSPLYHTVIKDGLVYYVAVNSQGRFLTCADAKTGSMRWRQRLEAKSLKFALSDVAGPAVTDSGLVYVYDWVSAAVRLPRVRPGGSQGQDTQSSGEARPVNSFTVKLFRAQDGQPLDAFPLAAMGANGVLPRVSLIHTPVGQEVRPVPPTFVGCPP
jgi:hypothetical protein